MTDRIEHDLRDVAAGAHPSPSAWESIVARLDEQDEQAEPAAEFVLAPTRERAQRPVWFAVAAVLVLVTGVVIGLNRPADDHSLSTADIRLTARFVSPRNGFSVNYRGSVSPAKQLWGFNEHVDDGFDVVRTDLGAVFKGASTDLTVGAGGVSIEKRVGEYLSDDYVLPDGCGVPREQQAVIRIDGESGRIAECPNRIEATVVVGGRLYLFTLSHERSDARAVFDAFARTVELTPETAVDFPAMTTTFVSPTYGYSFRYHDRGGLQPAKARWDPADEPSDGSTQFDERFDGVETGLLNYFEGASTEIPDGVAIDAWVDEHVSPRSCRVPRSQQEEITVDGYAGRIAECPNQLVATVAAGGRLYLFTAGHERRDSRAWFDAWLATIDLTPETAARP